MPLFYKLLFLSSLQLFDDLSKRLLAQLDFDGHLIDFDHSDLISKFPLAFSYSFFEIPHHLLLVNDCLDYFIYQQACHEWAELLAVVDTNLAALGLDHQKKHGNQERAPYCQLKS